MIGSRVLMVAVFAAVSLSVLTGCPRREREVVVREREVPQREVIREREVPVERERVREVEVERR